MTFYIQANVTASIDAAIGEYFPGSEGHLGELYQAKTVKGHQYEYLAGDACGCGCGGEAALIAYTNDGAPLAFTNDSAPVALWVCGSLFTPV